MCKVLYGLLTWSGLRRAAASQELDIQLDTPKRGNTHFMIAK